MTQSAVTSFTQQSRLRQRLLAGLVRVSLEREGSETVIVQRVDELLTELATFGLSRLTDANLAVGDLKPAGQAIASEQFELLGYWLEGLGERFDDDLLDELEDRAEGIVTDPVAFVEEVMSDEDEEFAEGFNNLTQEVAELTESIEPLLTQSALKQLTGGERVQGLLAAAQARREADLSEFAALRSAANSGGNQIDALLKDIERRNQAARVTVQAPDESRRLKELGDIAGQLVSIAVNRRTTGASAIGQPTVVPAKAAAPIAKKAAAPTTGAAKAAPAPAAPATKKPVARGKTTPEPEPTPAPAPTTKKPASRSKAAAATAAPTPAPATKGRKKK